VNWFGAQRGHRGSIEGARRGKALLTPSVPPPCSYSGPCNHRMNGYKKPAGLGKGKRRFQPIWFLYLEISISGGKVRKTGVLQAVESKRSY